MRKFDRKHNMLKANQLIENIYLKNKGLLTEELNTGVLTFDTLPDCVKRNFEKNITVSVVFIKKDGTVRHMAFRRNLTSYKKSDSEKTDKQLNYLINNNLMNVYDTNSFIKNKKANMASGMDPEQAAEDAAKKSFRNFRLENVMGFLCSGEFYDTREQNKIIDRFGPDIATQLTKSMISKMQSDEMSINEEMEDAPQIIGQQGIQTKISELTKKRERLEAERKRINSEIKLVDIEIKKWEKEMSPNQILLFPS